MDKLWDNGGSLPPSEVLGILLLLLALSVAPVVPVAPALRLDDDMVIDLNVE